jgi:hypothetical protein
MIVGLVALMGAGHHSGGVIVEPGPGCGPEFLDAASRARPREYREYYVCKLDGKLVSEPRQETPLTPPGPATPDP